MTEHLESLNEEVRQFNLEKATRNSLPVELPERLKTINALYDEIRDRIRQGRYGQDLEPVFAVKFPAPHP